MKIGVIIITYNTMPWHEKCFKLLAKDYPNGKVYIIDNGSTDGTQELILSSYPNFFFYQSEKNLGFGKANNLALKMALKDGCSHFLLLNQDASISWENTFLLADLQIKNQEFGILSPIQMHDDENVDKLHLKSLMVNGHAYFNDIIAGNLKREIYDIGYTNAAVWLISKNCLKKAGGFDPLFPHYGEDAEYAQRVNFLGLKVGLCAGVKAFHYRNQKYSKVFSLDYFSNSYLVQLKDLKQKLWKTYFSILLPLILSIFGYPFGLRKKKTLIRIKAFLKVLKYKKSILRNRNLSLQENYPFLDYHENQFN